jgi:hypothetical protein
MSIPVNPATGFQQAARASLAAASANWRDLTDDNRAAWQAWASTHPVIDRLGAALLLTSQQAYVGVNRNVSDAGLAVPAFPDPPPEPTYEFPFQKAFVVDVSGTAATFVITTDVQPAEDTIVFVYASPAVSPGRTNVTPQMKFLGAVTVESTDIVGTDVDLDSMWVERFGSLGTGLIGKKVAVTVRTFSEGQLSGATGSAGVVV